MTNHDLPPLPSSQDMREFASKFSEREWSVCCEYQEFLDGVSYDIKTAGVVAMLVFAHHGWLDEEKQDA